MIQMIHLLTRNNWFCERFEKYVNFNFPLRYRFKEYAIPWYMNKRYKRKKFYTPKFVEPYIR